MSSQPIIWTRLPAPEFEVIWGIKGPASLLTPGARVQVHRKDGRLTEVVVAEVLSTSCGTSIATVHPNVEEERNAKAREAKRMGAILRARESFAGTLKEFNAVLDEVLKVLPIRFSEKWKKELQDLMNRLPSMGVAEIRANQRELVRFIEVSAPKIMKKARKSHMERMVDLAASTPAEA